MFGLLVLAGSGDLPVGTASFPGAGMMPKLLSVLLVVLGLVLVLRARESANMRTVAWDDLRHATRVTMITGLAVLIYQLAGFVVTMGVLLFALTFAVERRPAAYTGVFSLGVVVLTYMLFNFALKTPLPRGPWGF